MFRKLSVCALLVQLFPHYLTASTASLRYVIQFPGGARIPFDISKSVADAKGSVVRTFPQLGIAIVTSSDSGLAASLSRKLLLPAESIGLVPAFRLPETTTLKRKWAPTSADSFFTAGLLWGIQRVGADLAWKAGFSGSHKTVVAVIDTGVAWNHPDLKPNVLLAKCFTSELNCNPYPSFSDHGTHVAGIIAAAFGHGSVVGVGPNLGLASYNIFEYLNECGLCAWEDSRWAAMIDAADRGFSVLNISQGSTYTLGGRNSNETSAFRSAEKRVLDYVRRSGATVVASAGNSSTNLSGPVLHLPGDTAGYVNVGATAIRPIPRYPAPASFDIRAYYSNYGAPLTVSAPGGDCGTDGYCDPIQENWIEYQILSTIVAADPFCAATQDCPTGYDWKMGTSMAAAHVSGAVGLIRDSRRDLSPFLIDAILKTTADASGSRFQFGHGLVNAYKAVLKARSQ